MTSTMYTIEEFLRPRYFDRQQLSPTDLNLAVDYLRARLRRHNRFLHGWGVVCGGQVMRSSMDDFWKVNITEGYAVTPLGDELYIPQTLNFDLLVGVQACLGNAPQCPDNPVNGRACIIGANLNPPGPDPRSDYNSEWVELCMLETGTLRGYVVRHTINPGTAHQAKVIYHPIAASGSYSRGQVICIHSGAQENDIHPKAAVVNLYAAEPGHKGNWRLNNLYDQIDLLDPQGNVIDTRDFYAGSEMPLNSGQVFLMAYPKDENECPTPGVPAKCEPAGQNYQFSRLRDSCEFKLVCNLPASHQDPRPNCRMLEQVVCGQAHPPYPTQVFPQDNGVVLATIAVIAFQAVVVDDLLNRKTLLSEEVLMQYLQCHCEQEPRRTVEDIDMDLGRRIAVDELAGIGRVRSTILARHGVTSLYDLVNLPSEQLVQYLSITETQAVDLINQAWDMMRRK